MNSSVNLKVHDAVVDVDDVLGVFREPLTTENTQRRYWAGKILCNFSSLWIKVEEAIEWTEKKGQMELDLHNEDIVKFYKWGGLQGRATFPCSILKHVMHWEKKIKARVVIEYMSWEPVIPIAKRRCSMKQWNSVHIKLSITAAATFKNDLIRLTYPMRCDVVLCCVSMQICWKNLRNSKDFFNFFFISTWNFYLQFFFLHFLSSGQWKWA